MIGNIFKTMTENFVYYFNDLDHVPFEKDAIYKISVGDFPFYLYSIDDLNETMRIRIMDKVYETKQPAYFHLVPKYRKDVEIEIEQLSHTLEQLDHIFDMAYERAPKKPMDKLIITKMGILPKGQFIHSIVEKEKGIVYGICHTKHNEIALLTNIFKTNVCLLLHDHDVLLLFHLLPPTP